MKCDICGELHSLDEGKIIKGSGHIYFVCNECEPDYYAICDDCGELVEEDRTYTTHDNRIICENCYDSNGYFTCEKCGKVVEDYHIVYIQDTEEYICDDCVDENYYQCMECGEWYSGSKILTDSEGQYLCENCNKWVEYNGILYSNPDIFYECINYRYINPATMEYTTEDYYDNYYDSEYYDEHIEYKDNIDYYKDYEELDATF